MLRTAGLAGLAIAVVIASGGVLGQQRNFEAEIDAVLRAAKNAAGFEFQGTLVRTCLVPQSGGENTTDNVPGYETGAEAVQRYFQVMQGCARAAQLRLEQRAATK